MKKIYYILICSLLFSLSLLALASCGSKLDTSINWNLDTNIKPDSLYTMYNDSTLDNSVFNNQSSYPVKTAQQLTGYHVEYNQFTNADTQLDSMMIDNTKCDMIKMTVSQIDNSVAANNLVDITDALTKWGPDILKAVPKEAWDSVTYKGRIYGIPEVPANVGLNYALVFNMDHLSQAGYSSLPTTLADFTSMLSDLKLSYGSDKQYVPFSYPGNAMVVNQIGSAFDMPDDVDPFYVDDSGNVKYFVESPATKKYLEYMGGISADGYVDKSSASTLANGICDKFAKGKISVAYIPYWNVDYLRKAMQSGGGSCNLGFVTRLKGDNQTVGKIRSTVSPAYFLTIPFYDAPRTGYVLDWIDKKMIAENWIKLLVGNEGTNYTKTTDANGKIVLTASTDPASISDMQYNDKYLSGNNVEQVDPAYSNLCLKSFTNTWDIVQTSTDNVIQSPIAFVPLSTDYGQIYGTIIGNIAAKFQKIVPNNSANTGDYDAAVAYWTNSQGKKIDDDLTAWYKSRLPDNQAAANVVIALISKLPALSKDVVQSDSDNINAARTAFDALPVIQQYLVTNRQVLFDDQLALIALA